MQLTLAQDITTLQKHLMVFAANQKSVALVPTMGALHEGHISLIEEAKKHADEVVVSIFVNQKQFGENEDFGSYPRELESDINKINKAGAALVYAPSVEDMYPEGFATNISVGGIANVMCGASRPVFFDGIATVVTKLLLRVLPRVAVFGEKDYQQLCVIRRLVADLDMPIAIAGAPIVREKDGLAMSSRNAYLSEKEREVAPVIYQVLQETRGDILSKGLEVGDLLETGKKQLTGAGFQVDYLELRADNTLDPIFEYNGQPARLLAGAWLGKTRLIDNISMELK